MNPVNRAWFDRWLKEDENEFSQKAPFRSPARIFVMGTGDGHKTEGGKIFHGGY